VSEMTNSPQGAAVYPGAPWAFRRAQAHGRQLREPAWGMGDAVITFIGAAVLGVATSLILVKSFIDPLNGWGLIVSSSAPWLMLAGWPIYTAWRKGNGARLDFGLLATRKHLRLGFVGGLVAIGFGGLIGIAQQQFTGPISSAAGEIAKNQSGLVLFVFAFLIMFGAPIVEELAFRGLLFSALMKAHLSGIVSVILSALIFSLFHFEPTRILILFAIGLVLGEVRRRTGSTLAAMVTHFVINTPATIGIVLMSLDLIPSVP